ncbi:hypothetical protein [Comamonas terrae]|uniref:AAA family ATPase n=1 Tax=Comamonas terrae TaxID=673548 RepID=A0ABW5UPZ3_9BURK|nr:hypothetical protein [Comamonas terrae]
MHTNSSIVVYGPQGCGKATNTNRLLQHFGLDKVYDADCAPLTSAQQLPRHGTLILATEAPPRCPVRCMSYDQAMRQIKQAGAATHG